MRLWEVKNSILYKIMSFILDTGLRRMKTKLEVRVPCYTGLPKSLANQKLLPSGMRYTRREVFRLSNKVVDNQVVTECYIQSRKNRRKFFSSLFNKNVLLKRTPNNHLATMTVLTILHTPLWTKTAMWRRNQRSNLTLTFMIQHKIINSTVD